MLSPARGLRLACLACLVGAALQATADQGGNPAFSDIFSGREVATLTPEQVKAYGNRAAFFRSLPQAFRPDTDWRSALSDSLATAEPVSSQGFEELIVRDYFGDRRDGVFADVGCYLPRRASTTYYLESRLGWRGVGIDVIEEYRGAWKKHRPRSSFVQAAVSDSDGEIVELHVAGVIATLEKDVIDYIGPGNKSKTIKVETSTLDRILEKEGLSKIDFLSMDIEGAELTGLAGFDIKRFRPELACIETEHHEAVIGYFESNGYELIEKYRTVDKINLYFRPRPAD